MRAFTGNPYPWGGGGVYQGVQHRVKIQKRDGSWSTDLSAMTIDGRTINWVNSIEVAQDIDQPMASASIELLRDYHSLSLIPTRLGSRVNWNPSTGLAEALIDVGRRITIETQFPGHGYARNNAGTWDLIFDGYVDTVDYAGTNTAIKLTCRDFGALLQDKFIEVVRAYGSAAGVPIETVLQQIIDDNLSTNPNLANATNGYVGGLAGAQPWTGTTSRVLNDTIRPTTRNGYYYQCTVTGVTGAGEPTWPTVIGNTVTDGAATWKCAGYLPTISTGAAVGWNLFQWAQDRQPVIEALRNLAMQIGGDIRVLFDTNAPVLWFTVPGRGLVALSNFTMTGHVRDVKASIDVSECRNRVNVLWYDRSSSYTRYATTAEDTGSEAAYGTRWCEIAEPQGANISSATQANSLRDAVLYDLKYPRITYTAECDYTPNPDLFDKVQLPPVAQLFDAAGPTCGVVGITHSLDRSGKATTTLKLRDTDAPGAKTPWLRREVRPGIAPAMGPMSDLAAHAVRVWMKTLAQSVASGSLTVVTHDTIDHDLSTGYVTGTGVWTCPRPGTFTIEAYATLVSASLNCNGEIAIYRTPAGGAASELKRSRFSASAAGDLPMHVTAASVQLGAGDTIDMRVKHNDASALTIKAGTLATFLQIKRIR